MYTTRAETSSDTSRSLATALGLGTFAKKATVIIPQVENLDWSVVAADVNSPLVITNTAAHAYRLCHNGQPSVAVIGASKRAIRKWLRARGASVAERSQMQ